MFNPHLNRIAFSAPDTQGSGSIQDNAAEDFPSDEQDSLDTSERHRDGEIKALKRDLFKRAEKTRHLEQKLAAAEAMFSQHATKLEARTIRAEVKALAIKAGMHDLDGLKLADFSSIKLNDEGEVVGAQEVIESLKASKGYLFEDATALATTTHVGPAPKGAAPAPKHARDMSDEEFKAAVERLKDTGR
ncbi:phage scaffolding protein [Teichococcus deserti]|uniref:phage scaffolding protein n=1 Tax=Teichococcus deserti TaxID=1817963 RepID=UPI000977971C|nr:phage scaffolding protein [Pseudoroseomonas deserti]